MKIFRVLLIGMLCGLLFTIGMQLNGRWWVGIPVFSSPFGHEDVKIYAERERWRLAPGVPNNVFEVTLSLIGELGAGWSSETVPGLEGGQIVVVRPPDIVRPEKMLHSAILGQGWKLDGDMEAGEISGFSVYQRFGQLLFVRWEKREKGAVAILVMAGSIVP